MTTLTVFKSSLPSINYIFKNGKPAIFINGAFRTDVDWEIGELTNEVKLGHPHIYIDKNEVTVDSAMLDPMAQLRARIIAEEAEKIRAAAGNPDRDMGTSEQQKLNVGTTRDIAEAAVGGSGTSLAARLVNLQVTK